MESKYKTILKIPAPYRPKSVLVRRGTPLEHTEQQLERAGITYPFIAKPNLGFRGLLVKKIHERSELVAYLERYPIDFILQELLLLPEEIGVLYYRMPGEQRGEVTSITCKEFLSVTGDGQSTVLELIHRHPRALLQLPRIEQQLPQILTEKPDKGQSVNLGIVGNHAKGTRFINSNDRINDKINRTFDRISKPIEGFYYGRFDLKCASFASLESGKGIKVIELNGVCSEPTHMYDPERGTYFSAIRDIVRHWKIIYRISRANRRRGIRYETHRTIAREFLNLFAYQRKIKELDKKEH